MSKMDYPDYTPSFVRKIVSVPAEPTEAMLDAARDWSAKKFGKPIGNDAARGCWAAIIAAAKLNTVK